MKEQHSKQHQLNRLDRRERIETWEAENWSRKGKGKKKVDDGELMARTNTAGLVAQWRSGSMAGQGGRWRGYGSVVRGRGNGGSVVMMRLDDKADGGRWEEARRGDWRLVRGEAGAGAKKTGFRRRKEKRLVWLRVEKGGWTAAWGWLAERWGGGVGWWRRRLGLLAAQGGSVMMV
ncbi:uncharacterized protein DS421_17g587220 [Arachis hypogaea]|nr:uncharacterized protein DS421_17g587220 [Arachis hypogaea]